METITVSINEIQNSAIWESLSWNQLNSMMVAIEKAKETVKIKEIRTLQTKIEEAQKALFALGIQSVTPITPVTPAPSSASVPVVSAPVVPPVQKTKTSYDMLYREVIILLAKYEQRRTLWAFAKESYEELCSIYSMEDLCFESFYQKSVKYFNLHVSRKFSQKMSRAKVNPENWNKSLPSINFDINKNVLWEYEDLEVMKKMLLRHDYVKEFYDGGNVSGLIGLK